MIFLVNDWKLLLFILNFTAHYVMDNPRIVQLKQFLEKDPRDAFSRYALALEYANAGLLKEAQDEFETLLQIHPTYTATYYHLGKLYEKQGQSAKAKSIYEQGIELTAQLGQTHANKELREALFILTESENN